MRKGQSAMEYLMTYGWAILVIIVVIAVLFYIGVLNPRNVTPTTCTFQPGFSCVTFILRTNGNLSLIVGQATGHRVHITGLSCNSGDDPINWRELDVNITNGQSRSLGNSSCTDSDGVILTGVPGETGKFGVWLNYTEMDTETKDRRQVKGDITVRYEP